MDPFIEPASSDRTTAPAQARLRAGVPDDALCIGVLATQVFLDTYAIVGIRPDLAREVLDGYSPQVFAMRLTNPGLSFIVAERNAHLIGFAEVDCKSPCPVASVQSRVELARLYVQRRFQRCGVGTRLLHEAEALAARQGATALWLKTWSGNDRALAFYAALGYEDTAVSVEHRIEGKAYENRVFAKAVGSAVIRSPSSSARVDDELMP